MYSGRVFEQSGELPDLPAGASLAGRGVHGLIVEGLQDRWREAVDWLSRARSGDVRGVLRHPGVPAPIET